MKQVLAGTDMTYYVSGKNIYLKENRKTESKASVIPAADKIVRGTVTDQNGEPLVGATVSVKGTDKGTVTDASGNFSIDVDDSQQVLVVSYIGFQNQEFSVGNKSFINISLMEDVENSLDELVVIGYGTMKKRDLTGAIASVSGKDLQQQAVPNALQALQGRVPGVVLINNTGDPQGNFSIRIRGNNSIKGSNDPLYIVDGMPMNVSSINTMDIKSVEVLKDASATAIYGSRGANGVVLITTVSGEQGTHVSYDGYYGWQTIMKKMEMTNGTQFAAVANEITSNDAGKPFFSDEQVAAFGQGFDWQDAVFSSAPIQNHNVTVSTGNERTKMLISGSAMLRDGIIKGTGYNKYNLRSIINHDINKWLHIDLNMGYTSTKTTSHSSLSGGNRGNSLLSAAYFTPAILRPYNDDGSYTSLGTTYSILSSNLWNPMILINETSSATRAHLSNIIAAIIWKPFRGFSFKPSLGVESNDYRSDSYRTSKYQWGSNSASVTSTSLRTIINENIANYTFDLGEDHDLNLMGGFTYQEYQRREVSASGSDFLSDAPGSDQLSAAAAFGTPSTSYQKWTLISWLGRVNYAYKGRYLATFSIRADGSSRYSEGNKWGYFPSAALAWRISDEPFMRNIKQISNLKLRLGYGETGSTAIEPYATLNMLAQGKSPIGTKGVATYYAASTQLPSSLKWETTSQWNIGVDAGFFDNRLRVTADYYSKMTRDLLNSVSLPGSTGYDTTLRNIGKMSNKGFELAVDGDIIRTNKLVWTAGANIATNRNRVEKLYNGQELYTGNPGLAYCSDNISLIREGEPLGAFYTYTETGYDENGMLTYLDRDGNGSYTNDDKIISGNPNPDFVYGLTTSLSYAGFDLNIFFQGSQGNEIFNITEFQNLDYATPMNYSIDVYNSHWSASNSAEQNAAAKYPKLTSKQSIRVSDRFVEDGSYLRLKNISLGYNLPVNKLGVNKWLRRARVYVSAQNLFTITSYSGQDPDISSWNNDTQRGYDYLTYPSVRTFTIGAKLEF
ncbi:MAG: TonB-dependent receptor [Prevotella sp.]|nr:TonB-dependent receptor [Prevotella sp.]